MDTLFWDKNWQQREEQEWLQKEKEFYQKEQWIIEGYVDERSIARLRNADVIIYLDIKGTVGTYNYIKRWLEYRGSARPELPNCIEKFSLSFLINILFKKERPAIENTLNKLNALNVIRLSSKKETSQFLNSLRSY